MDSETLNRLAGKIQKVLRSEVHPLQGATIRLLDSFLRASLGGGSNAYYGTFPADRIPPHLLTRQRFQIIVNTTRSDAAPGKSGHFVCIEATPDYITYIDPFGRACEQRDIIEFIRGCKRPSTFYNHTCIQDEASVFCPLYCALFVLYFHLKPRWQLSFSSDSLKLNEQKCMEQLYRLINDPRLTPKKCR